MALEKHWELEMAPTKERKKGKMTESQSAYLWERQKAMPWAHQKIGPMELARAAEPGRCWEKYLALRLDHSWFRRHPVDLGKRLPLRGHQDQN